MSCYGSVPFDVAMLLTGQDYLLLAARAPGWLVRQTLASYLLYRPSMPKQIGAQKGRLPGTGAGGGVRTEDRGLESSTSVRVGPVII